MAGRWGTRGLLALLAAAGCGGGDDLGPLVPVQGRITVNGKPLTVGTVIFKPDANRGNASPHEPRGQLGPDGRYTVMTNSKPGVAPGWYLVGISAQQEAPPGTHGPPKWLLPARFMNPANTGLACEATATPKEGAYDFDVKP